MAPVMATDVYNPSTNRLYTVRVKEGRADNCVERVRKKANYLVDPEKSVGLKCDWKSNCWKAGTVRVSWRAQCEYY